jgi:intein-encoded DNA endonuclease-like protein
MSKKQPLVALSLMEAKYMVVSYTIRETMWLRKLLEELGFPQKDATIIFSDSQGSLTLIKNLIHHKRIKHINIQHHFVKEMTNAKKIVTPKNRVMQLLYNPLSTPLNSCTTNGECAFQETQKKNFTL